MTAQLRNKLKGLVDHAVHPIHREEPEAKTKATAACDLLDNHWTEFFPEPQKASGSTSMSVATPKPKGPGVGETLSRHGITSASTATMFSSGGICAACDRPVREGEQYFEHTYGLCKPCRGDASIAAIYSDDKTLVHNKEGCREWLRDHLLERERNAPKRRW